MQFQLRVLYLILIPSPSQAAASAGIAVPGIGICYPSSCSQGDIQLILNEFYNSTGDYLTPLVNTCTTAEKPPFDTGDYAMM